MIVGAPQANSGAGVAYVLLGPVSGSFDVASADATLTGAAAGDVVGWSIASGDADADGYDDVFAGAPYESAGGTYAGAAFLYTGPVSGTVSFSGSVATLVGEADQDHAGYTVAMGDTDGDGRADMLVGAYRSDLGGTDSGAAYLVRSPASGTRDLSLADASFVGENPSGDAGSAVLIGDTDGNGLGDVLIGAYAENGFAGVAYIVGDGL